MRLLFLNQYFPPDPAPTGVLLGEVAGALRERGHEVELIDAQQQYRTGQGSGGRMRRELAGLGRMLRAGLSQRRPDVIISGTSPPCLLVIATLLARRFRARSIHWAMDLYPDLAVALGEIPPGGIALGIESVMRWCYRRTDLTLALDDDMAERLVRYGAVTECLRPWISERMGTQVRSNGVVTAQGEPWTWIYSGNLGRAHEWETLLAAQSILERQHAGVRLIFQGGGPSWNLAQACAGELRLQHVEWRPYAAQEGLVDSLLACNAIVVTQKPEIQGLLWPSKLSLALAVPRPLLFVGPLGGAIARELRDFPHAGVFAPGDAEGIAGWILARQRDPLIVPREQTFDAEAHREASLRRWVEVVEQLAQSPLTERKSVAPTDTRVQ